MGNKHMNVLKKNNKTDRNPVSMNYINEKKTKNIDRINSSKIETTSHSNIEIITPCVKYKIDPKFSFGEVNENIKSDSVLNELEKDRGSRESQLKFCKNQDKKLCYELIRIIGKGFNSKVYLARVINISDDDNSVPDKKFAIKVIKKNNNILTEKNIMNEKKILEKLSSLSSQADCSYEIKDLFINLIDSFQDESNFYFVFPYYEEDLFSILKYTKQKHLITENIIKFILAQLYLAVTYLHENKILFRDIKPENIVIDSTTGYIVLIDFGLAVNDVTIDSKLPELCGTNEYIPPELIIGEPYNFEFDWWGFGIFFYEILFGHPPFTGANQADIFRKILKNEIGINRDDNISEEAKDLLESLLNKDKRNRIIPEMIRFHRFFINVDFDGMTKRRVISPLIEILKSKSEGNEYFVNKNGSYIYKNKTLHEHGFNKHVCSSKLTKNS